jgi:hypothetical protein
MGIWLSWKLIVASILFLTSFASSESPDPLIDPASSEPRQDKPPIKISSVQFESVCVNIYDSQTTKNNKKIYFYSPMSLLNHKNVASIHNTHHLPVRRYQFFSWKCRTLSQNRCGTKEAKEELKHMSLSIAPCLG